MAFGPGIIHPGDPGYGPPPGPSFGLQYNPLTGNYSGLRRPLPPQVQAIMDAIRGGALPGAAPPVRPGFQDEAGGALPAAAPPAGGLDVQGLIAALQGQRAPVAAPPAAWGPRTRGPAMGRNRGFGVYRDPTGQLTYKGTNFRGRQSAPGHGGI